MTEEPRTRDSDDAPIPERTSHEPASPVRGEAGFYRLRDCPDPVMASLVAGIGPLDLARRRRGRPGDAFGSLVRSVVGQQLSTKAARTIYERLAALFGGRVPSPAELLDAGDEDLRAAGLSGRKTEYLRDLARNAESGDLDLDSLHRLTDEEVTSRLVSIRGLGRWTADMFLMFHLDRPDVLPVGDLGIRRAAERAYDLPETPRPDELRSLAEPWRPHRTLACIYLWESLDTAAVEATGS